MYTQTKGKLVDEDDPNDETKIPKTATDLRFPFIPLAAREASLDKIAKCLASMRDLERRLILKTVQPKDKQPKDYQTARNRISMIKNKTRFKHLTVRCEFHSCAKGRPEIPVYQNLCGTCHKSSSTSSNSNNDLTHDLTSDLLTVSNLITRLMFLQEQMSMSLSNLLNESELTSVYREINDLADCI